MPIQPDRCERFSAEVDEVGTTEWWRYDVLTVETQRVDATAPVAGSTFTPGVLRGKAFVFDYSTERVVCQLDVEARHGADETLRSDGQLNNAQMLMGVLEGRLLANTRAAPE